MEIERSREGRVEVVRVSGTLDFLHSDYLEVVLNEVTDQVPPLFVVVDLSGVEKLSSPPLRVLLKFAKRVRRDGGALGLSGAREGALDALRLSGFLGLGLFLVTEGRAEAVEALEELAKGGSGPTAGEVKGKRKGRGARLWVEAGLEFGRGGEDKVREGRERLEAEARVLEAERRRIEEERASLEAERERARREIELANESREAEDMAFQEKRARQQRELLRLKEEQRRKADEWFRRTEEFERDERERWEALLERERAQEAELSRREEEMAQREAELEAARRQAEAEVEVERARIEEEREQLRIEGEAARDRGDGGGGQVEEERRIAARERELEERERDLDERQAERRALEEAEMLAERRRLEAERREWGERVERERAALDEEGLEEGGRRRDLPRVGAGGRAGEAGRRRGRLGVMLAGVAVLGGLAVAAWGMLHGWGGGGKGDPSSGLEGERTIGEMLGEPEREGENGGGDGAIGAVMEGREAGEVRVFGGIEMVWCPPGEFLMGSPKEEVGRGNDEGQHRVVLTRGYWLAKTECTQGQWEGVMGDNPSSFSGDDLPVEKVSWEDVQGWLEEMNERHPLPEGWRWELPTEAQWEYACRAGTTTPFHFGGALDGREANFNGNSPYGTSEEGPYLERTTRVGSYAANAWGLHDMHGNVWEWCRDWYGEYPADAVTDPSGPETGSVRLARGGSWNYIAGSCRAASRLRGTPGTRSFHLGFRPAAVPGAVMEGREAGEVRVFGGIEMVWCPPGEFLMGSPEEEEERKDDEQQHRVILTRGFWLAKTECTQGQWEGVVGENPSQFKGEDLPVEKVSWGDVQGWLEAMNARNPLPEGWRWELPTEAQWEYACRAGTTTPFHFGGALDGREANFNGYSPYGTNEKGPYLERTTRVGSYVANAWGLHDMHGNVWEWCRDFYGGYPSGEVTDPSGPETGTNRVIRGGGWNNLGRDCRSAIRYRPSPDSRNGDLGFRLAAVPGAAQGGGRP